MCFGSSGPGGSIDSGAKEAAQLQAQTAKENSAREEARWQREQDQIKADKEAQAAESARQDAERAKLLSDNQNAQRQQLAAQGSTGVGASIDDIQAKQKGALAGYDTAFNDLKNKTQAQTAANAGGGAYLGQSNTLVGQTGFNQANTGGQRYYNR